MQTRADRPMRWVFLFLLLAALLAGLQVWNAITLRTVVHTAQTATDPATPKDALELETARQALIDKQIEILSIGELSISLTTGLSAAIAALATIVGAILALRSYLDAREKERVDRLDAARKESETREKERLDRLDAERKERERREKERQDKLGDALNETLTRLVATERGKRVVGAAGLLPFFTAERADFHFQALTALLAAARIGEEDAVVQPSTGPT
jgi:hypothetical protein